MFSLFNLKFIVLRSEALFTQRWLVGDYDTLFEYVVFGPFCSRFPSTEPWEVDFKHSSPGYAFNNIAFEV